MTFTTHAPNAVFVIYIDSEGNEHDQPIADITAVGTLIDPVTGDDMDIVRVEVRVKT